MSNNHCYNTRTYVKYIVTPPPLLLPSSSPPKRNNKAQLEHGTPTLTPQTGYTIDTRFVLLLPTFTLTKKANLCE